jgi:hypothetical protein
MASLENLETPGFKSKVVVDERPEQWFSAPMSRYQVAVLTVI